jgi:hypothetical protein
VLVGLIVEFIWPFTAHTKIHKNRLSLINSSLMTSALPTISIPDAYQNAVDFLQKQFDKPIAKFDEAIKMFEAVASRSPTNDEEKNLICNAKQNRCKSIYLIIRRLAVFLQRTMAIVGVEIMKTFQKIALMFLLTQSLAYAADKSHPTNQTTTRIMWVSSH